MDKILRQVPSATIVGFQEEEIDGTVVYEKRYVLRLRATHDFYRLENIKNIASNYLFTDENGLIGQHLN